jgi:Domain of unknown function (DUF4410)
MNNGEKILITSRRLARHIMISGVGWLAALSLCACATQSVPQFQEPFVPAKHRYIRVEACQDRSGFKGDRDLAAEATQGLTDKLKATNLFEISTEPSLVLTCDIEGFTEGNAFQRWLLPGWGKTEAKLAVIVFEKPSDKVLATLRSHSVVSSGGLFSVGADQYILNVVLDDIVTQLQTWAKASSMEERD